MGFYHGPRGHYGSRWKRGKSLKAIGRAFGKESLVDIYFLVAPHGGFRPAERRGCQVGIDACRNAR